MTTTDAIRAAVLRCLSEVVPEADVARLRPDVSLRQQLDIDSMDFLNFLLAIDASLKVEIPESDYARFDTLDGSVAYLDTTLQALRRP